MSESNTRIWFVCQSMSDADKVVGEPFTGGAGRWLYKQCFAPLGLGRSDANLHALENGPLETSPNDIVVAVGQPASKALGEKAFVTIPHPEAVLKRKDTGETARKMERVVSLLNVEEDAQTIWADDWQNFVDPRGGIYTYQKHVKGDIAHYDLRLESKNNRRAWGWTLIGGEPLSDKALEAVPKKEHPGEWLGVDKTLPDNSTMTILKQGTYTTGVVHNNLCELFLDGLTDKDKQTRVLIEASVTEEGAPRWASTFPADQTPLMESKTAAEITGTLSPEDILIYEGRTVAAGSIQEKMLVPISKAREEKQIVYGVVLDPYIVDAHGDWTPPADVEKLAHDSLREGLQIHHMHERPDIASYPVESWLVDYPSPEDYRAAMENRPHKVYKRKFGDDFIHSGTWMLGTKLSNKSWTEYKQGKLTAFSPSGYGVRRRIDKSEMPEIEVIDAI